MTQGDPESRGGDERPRQDDRCRIGVLSGTGTALKRTIPALITSQLCRVTVVHGRDRDRLKAVAALDPAIQLTDSEDGFVSLKPLYDAVFIGSPPFLHLRHLELAIELGVPIICEKPLIARREDYSRVRELLGVRLVPFVLAHQVRHQQAVVDLARLVRGGTLGSPVAADLRWCFPMNHDAPNARWKLDPALGGSNAMFDSGVHAVDLALALFGLPERVAAAAHRIRGARIHDAVSALLDYERFTVAVSASQSASAAGNDVRIVFENCVVTAGGLLNERAARVIEIAGQETRRIEYEDGDLYRREVEDFCRTLSSSVPGPGTSAQEALDAARILFAIEDAAATGRFVDLSGYSPR